MITSCASI